MTEEEKKKAVEAAKARVAQHAVGAAMAATALAPNLANAQTAEQSANISPTPIEQTVAAAPSSNIVMSEQEAANAPAFGSKEWLETQTSTDTAVAKKNQEIENKRNMRLAKANGQTLEDYNEARKNILNTLNNPAETTLGTENLYGYTHIGNFNPSDYLNWSDHIEIETNPNTTLSKDMFTQPSLQPQDIPQNPDQLVDRSKLHIINENEDPDPSRAGFYQAQTDETTIKTNPQYWLSTYDAIGTLVHETNHRKQYQYDALEQLNTPETKYMGDRLIETTAYASNYLAVAQLYTSMKEAGIKTTQITREKQLSLDFSDFQSNNQENLTFSDYIKKNNIKEITVNGEKTTAADFIKEHPDFADKNNSDIYRAFTKNNLTVTFSKAEEHPIEDILDTYWGLKETVLEHGFNINDKESVRNVVKTASKKWHNIYKEHYRKQHLNAATIDALSFSQQLDAHQNEDATYKAVSERVIKNVYIGQNTTVDLSHCRDLLDTCDKKEAQWNLKKTGNIPSYEELNAINTHLESKGLTTDVEKEKYLCQFMKNTLNRTGEQDIELRNIMLSHNPNIIYNDNIKVRYKNNEVYRITSDGKSYYPLSPQEKKEENKQTLDTARNTTSNEELRNSLKKDSADNEAALKQETPENAPLNRDELKAAMKQDSQNFNAELNRRTNELTAPTPEKTQEAKQKAPANLSQTLINQKIQSTAR